MRHIIIGTAGHVDHGKTTLIRALTGVDTDRLKEEQERGMTIDLGFASLTLPDGTRAGIVDVPGHERFIKNMLAGATGIDMALLVVAAEESVMPQTVEHLDILQLLEVGRGVVAITKADMVDPDWLGAVEEDIRQQLRGTFLECAAIVQVDAVRGNGTRQLKQALLDELRLIPERNTHSSFKLPIDRIFTRPGFGTVVTGTLTQGVLRVGDVVELHPTHQKAKVRGLQSFHKSMQEAECGVRLAVNLSGVDVEDVSRGMVVVPPGTLRATKSLDVALSLLQKAAKPLRDRTRVRLHMGCAEVIARVRLLSTDILEPGDTAFVQLKCETLPAAFRGDHFVIRSYSPAVTIGGGMVLNASPPRHRRLDSRVIKMLQARQSGSPLNLVDSLLQAAPAGEFIRSIAVKLGLDASEIRSVVKDLTEEGIVTQLDPDRAINSAILAGHESRVLNLVEEYHQLHPASPGMPREDIRIALGRQFDLKVFNLILKRLSGRAITLDGAVVRLREFQPSLDEAQSELMSRVLMLYQTAGCSPPSVSEARSLLNCAGTDLECVLTMAVRRRLLIRLNDDLYLEQGHWERAVLLLRNCIRESGPLTTGEFRELVSTTRKFAVPILERMDAEGITVRNGDLRALIP